MNYNKVKLYGKTLRLRSGISLAIFPTFNCNLNCDYCLLKILTGKMPQSKISTFEQWRNFILNFPVKIKEVKLLGGEPSMYSDYPKLANWLLEQGYHVKVFSNLTRLEHLAVKQNYRFIISATYHHSFGRNEFIKNLNRIRNYHRVDVYEINENHIEGSRVKSLRTSTEDLNDHNFNVSPALKLSIGCLNLLESLKQ